MTEANSTQSNRRMSLWEKWKKVSLPNKVSIITSITALILTIIGLFFTARYSEEQVKLSSTVATFQAQVQTTADYQYSQQFNVQKTQIAMQSQMDAWTRQQEMPFVKVIIPPEHIFIVEKITSEEISSGYIIIGSGSLEVAFANDGGANAIMKSIDWIKDVDAKSNLLVRSVILGDAEFPLPNTIEAQTPKRIRLNLEANIPFSEDPKGKSDYQLGEYWKKFLQSNPNHLAVAFSNTDTININIDDIQLEMPEASFEPDPPALFAVTNKTDLTVHCIDTDGKEISLQITNLKTKITTKTVLADGTCNSYPVGDYEFVWKEGNAKAQSKVISLGVNNPSTISLANSQLNIFDKIFNENLWGLGIPIIALSLGILSMLGRFLILRITEKGVLEIYSTRHDASEPVYLQRIAIYPWGGKTKIRLNTELMEVMIRKSTKDNYHLKILRLRDVGRGNERYITTGEISSKDKDNLSIGASEEGDLQISYHKHDTKYTVLGE